jgi:hypothetical protein
VFDLFDDDRNTKARSIRRREQPRSQAIARRPDKLPRKKSPETEARTQFATAPVPQSKPTALKPNPPIPRSEPANEPATAKVSCEQAKDIITKYAFADVVQDSCSGETYQFAATRGGKRFLIKISGQNGELLEVKRDSRASAAKVISRPQANYHPVPKSELPPP